MKPKVKSCEICNKSIILYSTIKKPVFCTECRAYIDQNMFFLFADGGKNRQRGCYGSFALYDTHNHEIVNQTIDFPELQTNNEAEYSAMIKGLSWCYEHHYCQNIVICSDSELLIRQMKGKYSIKAPNLRPLVNTVRTLLRKCSDCHLKWVSRTAIEQRLGH